MKDRFLLQKINSRVLSSWHKVKDDDRGMSMVMAIVVLSFVGLLLSIIMYMSLYNFEMKSQQFKIQENYYSAEVAMDEIAAGLQKEASICFSDAYISIMQKYSESLTDKEKEESSKLVWQKYKTSLMSSLSTKDFTEFVTRSKASEPPYVQVTRDSKITEFEDFIRISGVKVTYTDETGDVSIIETDINIKCPDLGFNTKFSLPIVVGYALVADNSIVVEDNVHAIIEGVSVYAGKHVSSKSVLIDKEKNESEFSTEYPTEYPYSIVVESGASLTFMKCPYVVAGGDRISNSDTNDDYDIYSGDIVTVGSGCFYADATTNVWARNIKIGDGTKGAFRSSKKDNNLVLLGNTYIKDDLTIGGRNTSVKLAGSYYGYGHSDEIESSHSSSIIFNGTGVEAYFSELNNLELLGNAYIGISSLDDKKENIPMGESMTSKAGQIAYLVPYECVGWYSYVDGGTTYYSPVLQRNPLPYADYYEYYTDYSAATGKTMLPVYYGATVRSFGTSLQEETSYGLNDKAYSTVINQDGWMYFYIDFGKSTATDPLKAAGDFFKAYYEANPQKMNRYLSAYVKTLEFPAGSDFIRLNLAGNILIPQMDASGKAIKDENGYTSWKMVDDSYAPPGQYSSIDTDIESEIYEQSYYTLCTNLSVNYEGLTGDEKDSVYQNLISQNNFEKLKNSHGGIFCSFYESNVNQSGSEIDNPNERVRVYFGNCSIDGNFNSAVNLVIVDGNVNISADYTGTIICSGQITISNNAVIKNDPDALSSVFTLQDESTGLCVANLFTSGEDFSLLEKEDNAQAMGDATFNTADLITYSGWKKY
ncbi:hypothetical protein [Butyrivibrio fibrisolvens]|uniref:hypothetical protein n=1 Tax=Butyrivibrio fibrisolvens TaxID=831 RepID=UPI0003B6E69D|nr:hypothetical protein [Butyrivibrio fibrisolvens]